GTFPVFGSTPIRPARYKVFPVRMPSLNGACTGPPASLMTLRVACGVDCEKLPCTVVRIPAATKTTKPNTILRFMSASVRIASVMGSRCLRHQIIGKKRRGECLELECNPAQPNKVERGHADQNPEQQSLYHRPPADFPQSGAGNSCSDQIQRDRQSLASQLKKQVRQSLILRPVSVDDSRDAKQKDEPGDLDLGFATGVRTPFIR